VRSASNYYEDGGRFPNPILANVRADDVDQIEVAPADRDAYAEAIETDGDWIGAGSLHVPAEVPLWIYDGQHREGGIEDLLERVSGFESFPVPLAITVGLSVDEEMTEFYEVNTNAKSVKTDLAWELLRKRAASDPELARLLDERGQDWILRGQEVVAKLQEMGGPWKGSIQLPNQKKVKSDRLTIPQAQFIRSLKPVLEMPVLAKGAAGTIAAIVDAYWKAIARVLPEPFARENSPKDFVIQKGPGAIALHRVLPQVIEVMRARGNGLADVDSYVDIMKELPNLSGQITREDGSVETVTGSAFWRSGPDGIASGFTGDAGRKRLGVMIQALLPRPSMDIQL